MSQPVFSQPTTTTANIHSRSGLINS